MRVRRVRCANVRFVGIAGAGVKNQENMAYQPVQPDAEKPLPPQYGSTAGPTKVCHRLIATVT